MTEPSSDSSPPPAPRRRSTRLWLSLLIVWALGVVSFLIWSALIVLLLNRILA